VLRSLEKKGLVSQPHTSAGRIPTDRGYRYYVDNLMLPRAPSEREKARIGRDLRNLRLHDVSALAAGISRTLSELASQLAVAVAPAQDGDVLTRFELLPLDRGRVLAVVDTSSGLTYTSVFDIDRDVTKRELADVARFINARIGGAGVRDARIFLERSLSEARSEQRDLIALLLDDALGVLGPGSQWVHCEGARFILRQPEFSGDTAFLGEIFDHEESLARLVRQFSGASRVHVTIGEENRLREMSRMSVVVGTYRVGNALGRLGVIGPTRMRYSRLVGLVGYVSDSLEQLFSRHMRPAGT
jgi:heat-inducible transcriptional repressor